MFKPPERTKQNYSKSSIVIGTDSAKFQANPEGIFPEAKIA
jgi:hypothetical protein